MDMLKIAKEMDRVAEMARLAKPLEQRKKEFIKNMDTDKMEPVEYARTKKRIKNMTEEQFEAMFKSMNSRGDL